MQWLAARDAVPTIRALRDQAERARRHEVERALRRLQKGESPEEVLEALSQALTNKLIHAPTAALHDAAGAGPRRSWCACSSACIRSAAGNETQHRGQAGAADRPTSRRSIACCQPRARPRDLDNYRKLSREHAEIGPVVELYSTLPRTRGRHRSRRRKWRRIPRCASSPRPKSGKAASA